MQSLCVTTFDVFHEMMVVIVPQSFFRDCVLILLGFLLTTSPILGLNYVDTRFDEYIKLELVTQTAHRIYSALEEIRRRWEIQGTTHWPHKSVHWLMISLVIELEVTPHNHRSRKHVPDIQNAYLPVVRDLVSKKPTSDNPCSIGLETS